MIPMPDVRIVPAERGHVIAMALRLRHEDRAELEAAGFTPTRALWRAWRISAYARTGLVDGEIAAMWGLDSKGLSNIGKPWFLTAPACERVPMTMVRRGREEVALMLTMCPRLTGFVDSRYRRAVRFLGMIGFALGAPFPFGPMDVPFRQYEARR